MRIVFVTELTGLPQEGARGWLRDAEQALGAAGHDVRRVELSGGFRVAAASPTSLRAIRAERPQALVYVPFGGLTAGALARFLALRLAAPRAPAAIAVLHVLKPLGRVPRLLRAPLGLFASARLAEIAAHGTERAVVVPPVVDSERFRPPSDPKERLREKLGLPMEGPLVVHVGHLRAIRNLGPLAEIALAGRVAVAVVGSSDHGDGSGIAEELRRAGAHVIDRYLPQVEHVYQAADAFVFPVVDPHGAIEVPLGVLEAAACGLPVASTRFGGLPELFHASAAFAYTEAEDLGKAVDLVLGADATSNRRLAEEMTPARFASVVESALR